MSLFENRRYPTYLNIQLLIGYLEHYGICYYFWNKEIILP